MARSVRKTFKSANDGTEEIPVRVDEAVMRQAQVNIRAKQEAARQNLIQLQGLEIKHLESERKFIGKEKERDVSAFNNKEIAAINHRYDRLAHRLERRHNTFLGKLSRVFGGHKRQQRQIDRINTERDAVVADRTRQHVRTEAQRQRSLTQHDVRVEKDLQEARERHVEAREKQRQSHEQGFDLAVKQEVNRLRHVPKQRM